MRVLIANPVVGDAYGQEEVVRLLSTELTRLGHEVFLLGEERGGALPPCKSHKIVPNLTAFHVLTPAKDRKAGNREATSYVESSAPDVIHFFDQYNAWFTRDLIARYPTVFSCHTVAPTCPASNRLIRNDAICGEKSGWNCVANHHRYGCLSFLKSPLHRMHGVHQFLFKRHAMEKVGAVIAISEYVKNLLVEDGFSKDKVRRIYNPVDVRTVAPFSGPVPDPLIVAACRLVPLKGLAYLLRAFSKMENKAAKLWIVGEGPEGETLRSLATSLHISDRVQFLGKKTRSETLGILSKATLVAQPNIGLEAFGLTVAEAQALGIPVVGFDIPALNEIVKNKTSGLLVPTKDEEALRVAMDKLLVNHPMRKMMSLEARERAMKIFPAHQHVADTVAVYETVLQNWKSTSKPAIAQTQRRASV